MKGYRDLSTFELGKIDRFVEREDSSTTIGLDSPARTILTDFAKTTPLVIDANATVEQAETIMTKAHVHLKFVLDSDENVVGIVTSMDLAERPLKVAAAERISRDDVAVKDVMTPLAELSALPLEALDEATIGDVITTLQHLGRRHMIVADEAKLTIRGLISASDIARKLHVPVDITSRATSFVDIYALIAKS